MFSLCSPPHLGPTFAGGCCSNWSLLSATSPTAGPSRQALSLDKVARESSTGDDSDNEEYEPELLSRFSFDQADDEAIHHIPEEVCPCKAAPAKDPVPSLLERAKASQDFDQLMQFRR